MPKLISQPPKYRRHSSRDLAFVVLAGRRVYLPGRYGSQESRTEYHRLCREWEAHGRPTSSVPVGSELTIIELLARFWQHAASYYVKNGRPTDELHCLKQALRPVCDLYGTTLAREFGPVKLNLCRQQLIQQGLARTTINQALNRIKRVFRWAASQELLIAVAGEIAPWLQLNTLRGLERGRSNVRETAPVPPVADAVVQQTLPHLPLVVRDMVQLQRLTGMRPGEVCQLRPGDLDRQSDVWRYVPAEHKTEHKGRQRVIYLGPQAQVILSPYLERAANAYCFCPRESERQRRQERHAARVTPLTQGNAPGTKINSKPRRSPGACFSVDSYRRAITRGCELAFGMPRELLRMDPRWEADRRSTKQKEAAAWRAEHCWAPNQLRHTCATQVRAELGLEAAQSILGHSEMNTTQIYAEKIESLALKVARQLG